MLSIRNDTYTEIKPFIEQEAIKRYLKIFDPVAYTEEVNRTLDELSNEIQPRALIFQTPIAISSNDVFLEAMNLMVDSADLARHLEGENKVWVVFSTIGDQVMQAIRSMMIQNPSEGVVWDACASGLAEGYAAYLNHVLSPKCSRFSPGYGDFSLNHQKDFSRILNPSKQIGVHVLESGLMIPEKSVCFVVGNGMNNNTKKSGNNCADCSNCSIKTCAYRRKLQTSVK